MSGARFLGGLMMIAGFVLIKSQGRPKPAEEEKETKEK
jgi:hypothetical protein